MATFDRFDIGAAHRALENDWNEGGWLRERPSNRRRNEATHIQLRRMGYRFAPDYACAFEYLETDNQREIYCNALRAFGLAGHLSRDDTGHAPIMDFMGLAT